jgi:hypothetical protein
LNYFNPWKISEALTSQTTIHHALRLHRLLRQLQDGLSADATKKLITGDLVHIGTADTLPTTKNPVIDAIASHAPLHLIPSSEKPKAGFYKKLYAFQGHRGTFYTGSACAGDYSSILWQFTEGILPLVAD